MKKKLLFLLGCALMASPTLAKDVPFEVIPWNGYKAALSLTYDDGDPIHLDVAVPEMAKRGLHGTFFLIEGKLERAEEWKNILSSGQEIGNHTVTHRHTLELKPEDEKNEVEQAKAKLEKYFSVPVVTFAYPFVEESPGLKKWVVADDFIARGGGGTAYLTPEMDPDWFDIPSQITMTAYAYETYKNWVDQDLAAGAWTVLMIHAIEGSNWYQPVPRKIYLQFLDYLVQNEKNLWVAPFGEIGAYWRAEKVLEKSEPQRDGAKTSLQWEKPANFPTRIVLKLAIQGEGLEVSQGGRPVKALSKGVYPISFDAKELTLENAEWKPQAAPAAKPAQPEKAAVIDTKSVVMAPDKTVLKVDDFESGSPAFGAGWFEGCDTNGVTKLAPVPFAMLTGGSPQSPGHCAGMKGHFAPMQAPWPWALLSLTLSGSGPMDLSGYKAVRFYAKGDGKSHAVALNKASVTDYCDFTANFISSADWKQVTVPFSDFAQANWGKQLEKKFNDVTKLTFSPGTPDADFDFKVDDVEFIK